MRLVPVVGHLLYVTAIIIGMLNSEYPCNETSIPLFLMVYGICSIILILIIDSFSRATTWKKHRIDKCFSPCCICSSFLFYSTQLGMLIMAALWIASFKVGQCPLWFEKFCLLFIIAEFALWTYKIWYAFMLCVTSDYGKDYFTQHDEEENIVVNA
jgi:hypothetical protein